MPTAGAIDEKLEAAKPLASKTGRDSFDDEEQSSLLRGSGRSTAVDSGSGEATASGRPPFCQWQALWRAVWGSGLTCMALASLLQSLAALFVKLTSGRIPVFEIVAVRSGLCMAATLGIIRWRGISPAFGSWKSLPPLFVRGAAGATSMSVYYFAIFKLSLADAMTLFFTHPAMTVVLAWLCKGEDVSGGAVLGITASLVGIVLVAQPPFLTGGLDWSGQHVLGVALCLIAAFLAAVAFVSIRFVPKTVASFTVALWFHAMGVLTSVVPLMLSIPQPPVVPNAFDAAMLFGIAAFSFFSHAFLSRAFLVESASRVAPAGYLQVVFAHVYGIALLHDPESVYGVLGSLVICIGVVAVSWPKRAASETPREAEPLAAAAVAEADGAARLELREFTSASDQRGKAAGDGRITLTSVDVRA